MGDDLGMQGMQESKAHHMDIGTDRLLSYAPNRFVLCKICKQGMVTLVAVVPSDQDLVSVILQVEALQLWSHRLGSN